MHLAIHRNQVEYNLFLMAILSSLLALKVFLKRDSDLSIPSLYKLFKGSDWQERETYDMYGINFIDHPNPKRLLMPEDWRGWPLRKDYIQPDFYELQDAY